jgi:hypothetical protein
MPDDARVVEAAQEGRMRPEAVLHHNRRGWRSVHLERCRQARRTVDPRSRIGTPNKTLHVRTEGTGFPLSRTCRGSHRAVSDGDGPHKPQREEVHT